MRDKQLIQEYLGDRSTDSARVGVLPHVTISRQAGAGGHTLAKAIVQRLDEGHAAHHRDWKIFDRDLCDIISRDPEVQVSLHALITEEYHSELQDMMNELLGKSTSQWTIYKKTFSVMRQLALIGKVILVGRGSAFVTGNMPGAVSVRLVAPEETRIDRMMKMLDIEHREAADMVRKQDRERSKLVHDFFDKDIDDPTSYHMVWNTARVDMATIADATVALINRTAQSYHH